MSASKVILITGAGRGIGVSIAKELASRGAKLALHYNSSEDGVKALVGELSSTIGDGGAAEEERFLTFKANLSDPKECEQLISQVVAKFGRLDVLVNNAGVSIDKDIREMSYTEWQENYEKTMSVNYYAASNLAFLASKQFLAQPLLQYGSEEEAKEGEKDNVVEKGRVVSISSRAAYCGDPTAPAYAVSKSCLNTMMQSMGKQLARDGVFFFMVSPGATDTDMWNLILTKEERKAMDEAHPLGRIGKPEEVAKCVGFYAFDAPALVTASVMDANGSMYTH